MGNRKRSQQAMRVDEEMLPRKKNPKGSLADCEGRFLAGPGRAKYDNIWGTLRPKETQDGTGKCIVLLRRLSQEPRRAWRILGRRLGEIRTSFLAFGPFFDELWRQRHYQYNAVLPHSGAAMTEARAALEAVHPGTLGLGRRGDVSLTRGTAQGRAGSAPDGRVGGAIYQPRPAASFQRHYVWLVNISWDGDRRLYRLGVSSHFSWPVISWKPRQMDFCRVHHLCPPSGP